MYAICVSGNACILNFPILPRSHVHSVSKVFFYLQDQNSNYVCQCVPRMHEKRIEENKRVQKGTWVWIRT